MFVGGIAAILFLATVVKSAVAAGIQECDPPRDLSCSAESTHIALCVCYTCYWFHKANDTYLPIHCIQIFSFLSFIVVFALVYFESKVEKAKVIVRASNQVYSYYNIITTTIIMIRTNTINFQRATAQVPVYQGSSLTQPILQATEEDTHKYT